MTDNIAKSSAKSKKRIYVLNNSGDSLYFDYALCFFNSIGRSFINHLKNIVLRLSPCLCPRDVLNGVETIVVRQLYIEVIISKKSPLIPNCSSLRFKLSRLIE